MNEQNDRLRGWYPTGGGAPTLKDGWYPDPAGALGGEEREEDLRARKKRRRVRIIAAVLCVTVLLSAGGAAAIRAIRTMRSYAARAVRQSQAESLPSSDRVYDDYRTYFENYYTSTSEVTIPRAPLPADTELTLRPAAGAEKTLQEIYEMVSPAVVGIICLKDGVRSVWGTGVIFTSDGYIITNAHIVAGCDGAFVSFTDGTECEALLVGSDNISDIAVLKIDGTDLPCAVFGDSDELRVGDPVAAIGNPIGPNYAGTMTDGIISSINRDVSRNGYTMTLLQTNAALNEGNSGGPLVNRYGQVIGITNMKLMTVMYTTVEGIGFAIPSTVVRDVANQLLENGTVSGEAVLGITAGSVTAEAASLYDIPQGVYVSTVNSASRSGLLPGDVIVAVNGVSVTSVAEINAQKEGLAPGDSLLLDIWRDGGALTVTAILVDQSDLAQ